MRATTYTLLALPLLVSSTLLTPPLAHRYIPQQILVNFSPLTHPCTAYASTDTACGLLCLPEGYTCCPDKLGGCKPGESCVKGDNGEYGCCGGGGGKCTGDGGIVDTGGSGGTSTEAGKETTTGETGSSKTTVTRGESTTTTGETSTTTGESSTSTDAETTTTSAETTTTDAQPTPTGETTAAGPTVTGGAAAVVYGAGSMGGVVGAVVVGLFVL